MDKKEDLRNGILIPRQVKQQTIPETTSRHINYKKIIGSSEHGFTKRRYYSL